MGPRRAGGGVITTVISDFGGVLTTPLAESFAAWSSESGIQLADLGMAMAAAAERHGESPLFQLERGELTEREFIARIEAELGHPLDSLTKTYFEHLQRNDDAIALMTELRDRGLRMAMLTNNVREWEAQWRSMLPEIDAIFELVVDSAFVGLRKPDPKIYELTLERLGGVPADECIFVDDIDLNCAAARELGMTAVLFETTEQARAEVEAALA
jgi:epoxide hydrolase-like predicted phosphatase